MKPAALVALAGILLAPAACDRSAKPPPAAPSTPAPPPLPPVQKRAAMTVVSSTWRTDGPPFDVVADLKPRFRAVGIEVADSGATDGSIRIEYRESKGSKYLDAFSHPVGSGTDITLTVTVRRTNAAAFPIHLRANTGGSASGGLYEASIANFKARETYKRLGHVVGAVLGIGDALPHTVPILYDEEAQADLAALYRTLGYLPPGKPDQAQLLIVRREFEACVPIGRDAVAPLLAALERGFIPEFEIRTARALGRIGDPRPARAMLDKAKEHARWAFADAPQAIALLEAVGLTGDAAMLPELDELTRHEDQRVAEAARSAKAAISNRH